MIMVKTRSRSDHPWSAIFSVIVYCIKKQKGKRWLFLDTLPSSQEGSEVVKLYEKHGKKSGNNR